MTNGGAIGAASSDGARRADRPTSLLERGTMLLVAAKDTRDYNARKAQGQDSESYRRLTRRSVAMPDELWELVREHAGAEGMSPWIRRVVAETVNRPDLGADKEE